MAVIVVAEDDRLQAELVARYLAREGHEVVGAGDGATALAAVAARRPALLLLDVMLPGVDGLTVARTLRERGDGTAILMLTARATENDLLLGLELGADDYLTKPYSPRELVARVRALLRRAGPGAEGDPRIVVGDLVLDPRERTARVGDRPVELTRAEFELLEELARHPGAVLSRSQLLGRLHGGDRWIGTRTIDAHVKNLRRKIEVDARTPQRLLTVHGVGYRLTPGAPAAAGPEDVTGSPAG